MADTFKGIVTADGKKRQLPYGSILDIPKSDPSLTVEGGFADAAVVGKKNKKTDETIASLKEDIISQEDFDDKIELEIYGTRNLKLYVAGKKYKKFIASGSKITVSKIDGSDFTSQRIVMYDSNGKQNDTWTITGKGRTITVAYDTYFLSMDSNEECNVLLEKIDKSILSDLDAFDFVYKDITGEDSIRIRGNEKFPCFLKQATQVTVRRIDGANFISDDQIIMYDKAGNINDKWSLYGFDNGRTITIAHDTYYISSGSGNGLKVICSDDGSDFKSAILKKIEKQIDDNINNVKKTMDGHLGGGSTSYLEVNINTGDVYIRNGNIDIFYGTGGKFRRFSAGEKLCKITSTTSSDAIMYIPSTDSVIYGSNQSEGIVIATCFGMTVFPNNGITVKYTDGKNQYNPYLTGIKLDEHTRDISDLKASIGIDLPNFVLNTAKNTFKRLINWIGSDDACLVAFVTDVHSGGNTKYKHVGYLSELNKLFGFDILVNGGDIGTDFSTDQSIENENVDNELITNTKLGMDCTSLWVLCKGNHERTVATAKIGASFNKCLLRRGEKITFGDVAGTYGFIDLSNDCRLIFLNTTDTDTKENYYMSKSQIEWLVNTLSESDGKSIVIASHLCIDQIGRWSTYPNDANSDAFDALRSLLADYVSKSQGSNSVLNLSWNFAGATGRLVCSLAGDSHFNNSVKRNGVNYIVRQGYGYVDDSEMPSGATKDTFNTDDNVLFDILAIKSNGKAKIFRIGAGGEARDYEFSF
jgi:hypothetical protein